MHSVRMARQPCLVLALQIQHSACFRTSFADYYFRVTKKEHLIDLKDTCKTLCMYSLF